MADATTVLGYSSKDVIHTPEQRKFNAQEEPYG